MSHTTLLHRHSLATLLGFVVLGACSSNESPTPAPGNVGSAGSGASAGSSLAGADSGSGGTALGGLGPGGAAGSSAGGTLNGAAGSSSGAGGSSSGGAGGNGSGGAKASQGCDAATWPATDRYTIESGGQAREYELDVPDDYDPSLPHRLVFGWHWRGGNAQNVVNGAGNASRGPYYGLKALAEGSTIFVAPEGLVDSGVTGWANPDGRDIQFLRDMLARLNGELCIDEARIFSTGFSYGGMMSIAVGCAMGDVFRAVAPMAGAAYSGCEPGAARVAFWGSHAPGDSVVDLVDGQSARDTFLQRNGCGSETMPVSPEPCVTYQGCQADKPVTWCEFEGDHFTPDFAPQGVWGFFSQF